MNPRRHDKLHAQVVRPDLTAGRTSRKESRTATTPTPHDDHGATRIAAWSALGGLLAGLAVPAISGRLALDEHAAGATALGALGFTIALLAPFVAAFASFLTPNPAVRRSVWLASGVLAWGLGVLTIFSGFWLVFAMVGVGLVSAWWRTRSGAGSWGPARSLVLTGWLLLWLGGALPMLWLRETPASWDPSANGSGWVARTSLSSAEWASDIVDNTEGLLALGCVVIGLAGMALLGRGGNPDKDIALNIAPPSPLNGAPAKYRSTQFFDQLLLSAVGRSGWSP